jgi:protein TonB
MNAQAVPAEGRATFETANDRFKRSFSSWFWGSMIAATVLHFVVFAFWPDMSAEDFSFSADEMEAVELPPEIEIPPPPEQIARPAQPVIAEADIDEDITIAPTTFESNPVEDLPPPPEDTQQDLSAQPTFTPYTVAPNLTNESEVQRALEREYPPLLRDAGIGGRVLVYFFIDETGKVIDTRINQSSGHSQLDDAALAVADVMRFTPAMNRDKKVPVWISLPITFQVR